PPQPAPAIGGAEPPFRPDVWSASARRISNPAVKQGLAEYEIPAAEWAGQEVVIAARAIGANGKTGAWSNVVDIAVVPSPPAPANVHGDSVAEGVRLSWQGDAGEYRVLRRAGEEKQYKLAA